VPHSKQRISAVQAEQVTSRDVIPGQNRTAIAKDGRPPQVGALGAAPPPPLP
jgi:hypothetical protein